MAELEIDKWLADEQVKELDFLTEYNAHRIFISYEDLIFILAIDDKNKICGCFEFHESEDGVQLAHMNVSENSQRQGIGKAIVSEAVELWTSFKLPTNNTGDYYHYIDYGLSFIQSCFADGTLKAPAFKYPQ